MIRSLFTFLFSLFSLILLATGEDSPQYQFIENKGQWPASVLFACDIEGGRLWVEHDGLLIDPLLSVGETLLSVF